MDGCFVNLGFLTLSTSFRRALKAEPGCGHQAFPSVCVPGGTLGLTPRRESGRPNVARSVSWGHPEKGLGFILSEWFSVPAWPWCEEGLHS